MKRIIFIILLFSLVGFLAFAQGSTESAEDDGVYLVGISKLVSHPALDAIEEGIKDYLDTLDYKFEYDVQNANGEITAATQIAHVFENENTDINIAIATPTAQAIANVIDDTPLIFSSVTDPVAAGLVGKGIENIAGVSDMVPVSAHLSLIREVLPDVKSIGMVYTSGEANGIVLMETMKKEVEESGLEFISASVSNSSEVRTAAESIIDRVDAMYVATDNTVVSAITALSDVCMKHSVPLFSADTTSSVNADVLLSGGFDYYQSGILTAKIVERYLNGESLEDIGTLYLDQDSLEIYLNLDVADRLGLEINEDLVNRAKSINYGDGYVIQ